jgi:hypothetical protein
VPGALDDVLKLKLFDVVSKFMDETSAVNETDTITTIAGVTEYEVFPTGPYQITRLLSLADTDGREVDATMDVPGTIILGLPPEAGNVYTASMALKPLDPVDNDGYVQCPDWLVNKYSQVFVHGVMGALFSLPAKPYSNERLAIYHMRAFNAGIGSARVDVARRNRYRSNQWAYPRTFA